MFCCDIVYVCGLLAVCLIFVCAMCTQMLPQMHCAYTAEEILAGRTQHCTMFSYLRQYGGATGGVAFKGQCVTTVVGGYTTTKEYFQLFLQIPCQRKLL